MTLNFLLDLHMRYWPPHALLNSKCIILPSKSGVWPSKFAIYFILQTRIVLFNLQRCCLISKDVVWPPKMLFDLQRCCLASKDVVWPLFKLCSVCRANITENIGNMTINCEDINGYVEGGPNKTSGLAYMSAITIGKTIYCRKLR